MPADRSTILTEALKVPPSEVRWYFIADYYDGPISGLAFFRERLYRCCCFQEDIPDHHVYVLHELTAEELTEELLSKEKFETLVGTHFSFDRDGSLLPRILRSEESQKAYYDEEKPCRERDPWEHPVAAWFDVSSS